MSYTPTTWANGDTITAAKLNNMESGIEDAQNGWSVTSSSTQLCSETVTTSDNWGFGYAGALTYSTLILADSLTVTFDGTEYTCPITGGDGSSYSNYGAINTYEGTADYTTYPFGILFDRVDGNYLITETAGTHTVVIAESSTTVTTTEDFQAAVLSIGALPLLCVSGTTTAAQMSAAQSAGRLMYFIHNGYYCFITSYDGSHITYVSDSYVTVTASIVNEVFTVS